LSESKQRCEKRKKTIEDAESHGILKPLFRLGHNGAPAERLHATPMRAASKAEITRIQRTIKTTMDRELPSALVASVFFVLRIGRHWRR
jgi:hypothetical protein